MTVKVLASFFQRNLMKGTSSLFKEHGASECWEDEEKNMKGQGCLYFVTVLHIAGGGGWSGYDMEMSELIETKKKKALK